MRPRGEPQVSEFVRGNISQGSRDPFVDPVEIQTGVPPHRGTQVAIRGLSALNPVYRRVDRQKNERVRDAVDELHGAHGVVFTGNLLLVPRRDPRVHVSQGDPLIGPDPVDHDPLTRPHCRHHVLDGSRGSRYDLRACGHTKSHAGFGKGSAVPDRTPVRSVGWERENDCQNAEGDMAHELVPIVGS